MSKNSDHNDILARIYRPLMRVRFGESSISNVDVKSNVEDILIKRVEESGGTVFYLDPSETGGNPYLVSAYWGSYRNNAKPFDGNIPVSAVTSSQSDMIASNDYYFNLNTGNGGYWFVALPNFVFPIFYVEGQLIVPESKEITIAGAPYKLYSSPVFQTGAVNVRMVSVLLSFAPDPPTVPGAPLSIAASAILETSATLTFTLDGDADYYEIMLASDIDFNLNTEVVIATASPVDVSDLLDGTTYYVKYRAFHSGTPTIYSSVESFTTTFLVPAIPVVNAQMNGTSDADVTWAVANPYTGFKLETSTDGVTWSLLYDGTGNTALTYNHQALTPGETYYYRVKALNGDQESGWSQHAYVAVPAITEDPELSLTVSNITDAAADITFTVVPDADSYDIQIATDAAFTAGLQSFNTASSPYTLSGLAQNTAYYVRYRFNRGAEISAYSTAKVFGTSYATPALPTALTATAVATDQIDVSWSQAAPFTGFKLEYSLDDATWSLLYDGTDNTATSYSHTALSQNNTYYYRVKALNGDKESAFTASVNETTSYEEPAVPANLAATENAGNVDLSWDASLPYTGFKLEHMQDGGAWAEIYDGTGNTATSYSHATPAIGHDHHYRVKALNGPQESAFSATETLYLLANVIDSSSAVGLLDQQKRLQGDSLAASTAYSLFAVHKDAAGNISEVSQIDFTTRAAAITAPSAPQTFAATVDDDDQVTLNWTAPASDGGNAIQGYKIEYKKTADPDWIVSAELETSLSHVISGLEAGTSYDFRASAYNDKLYGTTATDTVVTTATGVAPSSISIDNQSVEENVPVGTIVGNVTIGGSPSPTPTVTLEGPDAAKFTYDSAVNALKVAESPNFETKPIYDVTMRATNSAGTVAQQIFVFVGDEPETITQGMTLIDAYAANTTFTNFEPNGGSPFTLEFEATFSSANGVVWEIGDGTEGIAVFADSGYLVIGMGNGAATDNSTDACFVVLSLAEITGRHKITIAFKPSADGSDPMRIVTWIDDVRGPETENGIRTTVLGTNDGGYGVIGGSAVRAGGPAVNATGTTLHTACNRYEGLPDLFNA